MVLGQVAAGAATFAGSAHAIWGYNRANFLYDREMRQEQEFQIIKYRNKQAELWREDVRDLIELTEKKMDSYLVITTIQLGMCVLLFTEGRLEAGTPQWLLRIHIITLGAAFVYLLMSAWLAMHASIVAQSSAARLLTQLIRLPVPSWDQLEATRTYSAAYETLGVRQMLRVPFLATWLEQRRRTQHRAESGSGDVDADAEQPGDGGGASPKRRRILSGMSFSSTCGEMKKARSGSSKIVAGGQADADAPASPKASSLAAAASAAADMVGDSGTTQGDMTVDPWGLEREGNEIYELQHRPTAVLRHVELVRRAAAHYQCYDAFARVAMSFGTHELLNSISYYCLGYVIVQDGAVWPAWSMAAVTACMSSSLMMLDMSLTRAEQRTGQVLILLSPVITAMASCLHTLYTPGATRLAARFMPAAFLGRILWFIWVLRSCGVERQPSGAVLPTKFRTVLYLDVFGWIFGQASQKSKEKAPRSFPQVSGDARKGTSPDAASVAATTAGGGLLSGGDAGTGSDEACTPLLFNEADVEAELRKDVLLWELDAVQSLMSLPDKARVRNFARHFRLACGGGNLLEADDDDETEPDRELLPASAASQGRRQLRWLKFRSHVEEDAEVLCCVDVLRGTVLRAGGPEGAQEAANSNLNPPLTLVVTEDRVRQFCEARGHRGFSTRNKRRPTGLKPLKLFGSCEELSKAEPNTPPRRQPPSPVAKGLGFQELLFSPSGKDANACSRRGVSPWQEKAQRIRSRLRIAQNFPLPTDSLLWRNSAASNNLLRPEDIEHAAAGLAEEHHEDLHRHFQMAQEIGHDPRSQENVAGIGSSAVPNAHPDTFSPVSFFPQGHAAASDAHVAGDEEIVTGHDRIQPGRVPWQVFRNFTRTLLLLWCLAFVLSIESVSEVIGIKVLPLPAVMENLFGDSHAALSGQRGEVDIDSNSKLIMAPGVKDILALPLMSDGGAFYKVDVKWPHKFSFAPTALSCDRWGKNLVLADDFGVYTGQISRSNSGSASTDDAAGAAPPRRTLDLELPKAMAKYLPVGSPSPLPTLRRQTNSNASHPSGSATESTVDGTDVESGPRSARGQSLRGEPVPAPAPVSTISTRFQRQPPCLALEGQALKDLGMVCSQDSSEPCHVLVLHGSGKRLADCPLDPDDNTESGTVIAALDASWNEVDVGDETRPRVTWHISDGWLDKKTERVESVAVDPQCQGHTDFAPDNVGCVIVGTNSGRIVQLRRHVSDKRRLVPEWATRSTRHLGSLHVFPGGFMLLLTVTPVLSDPLSRQSLATVQALDVWSGSMFGEWRLPREVHWLALCGGGSHLYLLGRRRNGKQEDLELWRFEMPKTLKARIESSSNVPGRSGGSGSDELADLESAGSASRAAKEGGRDQEM